MEDLKQLTQIAGAKMIPFLKSSCLYFVLDAHKTGGEWWTTILKCAPIASLMIFILLYGYEWPKRSTYAHKILFGLIFSCCGDALLNHGHFTFGMLAFGVAQIFYTFAFKSQTLKLWIAICLYGSGVMMVAVLHKKLESIILIGLPIYTLLLLTMCWRSIARACDPMFSASLLPKFCAFGSLLFVISDSLIALDKFHSPIPYSTELIMVTYYIAQFAITLSIVDLNGTAKQK